MAASINTPNGIRFCQPLPCKRNKQFVLLSRVIKDIKFGTDLSILIAPKATKVFLTVVLFVYVLTI